MPSVCVFCFSEQKPPSDSKCLAWATHAQARNTEKIEKQKRVGERCEIMPDRYCMSELKEDDAEKGLKKYRDK